MEGKAGPRGAAREDTAMRTAAKAWCSVTLRMCLGKNNAALIDTAFVSSDLHRGSFLWVSGRFRFVSAAHTRGSHGRLRNNSGPVEWVYRFSQ